MQCTKSTRMVYWKWSMCWEFNASHFSQPQCSPSWLHKEGARWPTYFQPSGGGHVISDNRDTIYTSCEMHTSEFIVHSFLKRRKKKKEVIRRHFLAVYATMAVKCCDSNFRQVHNLQCLNQVNTILSKKKHYGSKYFVCRVYDVEV